MFILGGIKLSLNPQQQLAVNTTEGPLLILAGAGSGKTTVLMNRIASMVQKGIAPWNILAVTFTNKAAAEMRERIERHISKEQADRVHMSTFHSFCLNLLKREWKELDIFDKAFDISEPNNSSAYIRGIIKGKTKVKPNTILGYISALKNEMVDAEAFKYATSSNPYIDWEKVREITNEIDGEHLKILDWAYPAYEQLLKEKNMVDFDDLILLTIKLFLKRPDILEKYQNRFPYIMVDEYQDTNRAQYVLIKLLAEKYKNLAVVGDDFQSIYAFRGSDIRNILNFDIDYPEAKIIKLEQNYRSTKVIIDAANQIIDRNDKQKKKTLFTENQKGDPITIFRSEYPQDGAEWISHTILNDVRAGKRAFKDFTILYRSNSQSADAELSLAKNGIPFVKLSGRGFFETEEIQDILKYLEFIHNPNNLNAFSRIIRKPKRRIAEKTIKKIEDEFYDGNLLDILDDLSYIERVQKKAIEEGKEFAAMIRRFQAKKETVSVATIIKDLLNEIQYDEKILSAYDKEVRETKKQNIDKMLEMILTKEATNGQIVRLSDYVEEIMLFDSTDKGDDSNAVKLMTIHGSKGLEFPVVFILGMNQGTFPSIRFQAQNGFGNRYDFAAQQKEIEKSIMELEEERRMCYVAFTRAKEKLYLTYSTHRILKKDGTRKPLEVSQFIREFNSSLKDMIL